MEHGTRSRRLPGSSKLRVTTVLSVCTYLVFFAALLQAQSTVPVDPAKVQALGNPLPSWARSNNFVGPVPQDLMLDPMTVVLSRPPMQQRAFEKFLADQQNPSSPEYHHWITPAQLGERFGLSEQEVGAVSSWLQSEGLKVNWVSPSRTFIGFTGTVGEAGKAFGTGFGYYAVHGVPRISVSSAPMIPQALAPMIGAIHGLSFIDEKPMHYASPAKSDSPALTVGSGTHFISPADFATIYDVPVGSYNGTGVTIGIVGRSRTDFADFDNFRDKTGYYFPDPIEIIPTALGGVDPGPALTAPPAAGVSFGDQTEATLDVSRAGSVAPGANLLLVVATRASGGIEVAAQYLVETTPVPAQIMSVSFGECESEAGINGVNYWDALFQQAAAEGISAFVASGDSGASGCDPYFATPPTYPLPNSPNYICSSSYATCVGGTEFNDATNPSLYWSSTNSTVLGSALSYIPEGGWNEPLNSSAAPQSASSGGGVSSIIATPPWQTGTGVPAARSGRYTPDIAFSAAGHDGYFGCMAATGGDCVTDPTGSFYFEYFFGTSAAAPSMAGITALLDEKLGAAQGEMNPQLYHMAASTPAAFHDVTVATSGVSGCTITTPSMCNNSIPGPAGIAGGQAGYSITAGYDEVTGLGSLNAANFINGWHSTQTITFQTVSSQTYGVGSIGLLAAASSNLPVTLSVTTGPATVSGDTLTILGAGTITVLATQPGNSTYFAATPVSQTFTVSPALLTVACESASLNYGWPIPTLPVTLTGVVAGDAITAACSTTAVEGSAAGAYPITPVLSDPNGRLLNYTVESTSGTLTIGTPATSVALLLSLSPVSAKTGGGGFTLTLTGANFAANSVVLWNGEARATTYVSSAELKVAILASDIAKEGTGLVTVANIAPNAGTSAAQPFAVVSATPVPTLTDASLAMAADGSGNHVLTLTGTDFISSSKVDWNGASLTTSYWNPWHLSAVVTTLDYATLPGNVTVKNSASVSNTLTVP